MRIASLSKKTMTRYTQYDETAAFLYAHESARHPGHPGYPLRRLRAILACLLCMTQHQESWPQLASSFQRAGLVAAPAC